MAGRSLAVPLRLVASSATHRGLAPVTMGIPFPRACCRSDDQLELEDGSGRSLPLQSTVLDRWSDGSIRWALLDFQLHLPYPSDECRLVVHEEPQARATCPDSISCEGEDGDWTLATASTRVRLEVGKPLPIAAITSASDRLSALGTATLVVGIAGQEYSPRADRVFVETSGPLRTTVRSEARIDGPDGARLECITRVTRYAGLPCCRVVITIRNPRRSRHPGGKWVLGDAGSLLLQHASVDVQLPRAVTTVLCSAAPGAALESYQTPFLLYQDSSGGTRWSSPVHRNRNGEIRHRFRGYRLRESTGEREGLRATPLVVVRDGDVACSLAVPDFWQNCPRALEVSDAGMRFGMFPTQYDDEHELQGGEQKTHEFFIAPGDAAMAADALEWCRSPLVMAADPQWYATADAVSFLTTEAEDPHRTYVALGRAAVEGPLAFAAKAERVDEFGWRHFGDLYADHEAVHQSPDTLLVSHYNNQYDAVAAFACQYFRTADPRWWRLMDTLAAHVIDIDVYHTSEDKAAYNGGLFWHTQHYTDAGTATHRTYPREEGTGGGPSAEHNYTTGLMLHHFLTGSAASRDTVIGLADWVLRMDDGDSTVFRWLARGPTGLASATGSELYHGPGRGAANSIVACLDASRLTRNRRYDEKAAALLRRCIHPQDDLAALNLLDAERRWYYTVFLQAIARILEQKHERGEVDEAFAYARASLLHYARWMAGNERPYLDTPERLEHPTETWAAQDLRKAEVLDFAAFVTDDANERARFAERAHWFFTYAVSTLANADTRALTRPLVLLLALGFRHAWFRQPGRGPLLAEGGAAPDRWPDAVRFRPQKHRALRRARAVLVVLSVVLVGLLSFWWRS